MISGLVKLLFLFITFIVLGSVVLALAVPMIVLVFVFGGICLLLLPLKILFG